MDLYSHFRDLLRSALEQLRDEQVLPEETDFDHLGVEPPRDPSHGDISSNAAMILAKTAKMKPRDLAERIAGKLASFEEIEKAEIAGPGFINLTIARAFWDNILLAALVEGERYGQAKLGAGDKVNVEFVSANPTGPMHVGHTRGAVFGDSLANLLVFAGYDVTREYYINDAGAQIDVLAKSAFLRYKEALGEDIGAIPEGLYPGEYLKAIGSALVQRHGDELAGKQVEDWLPIVKEASIELMMEQIKDDLKALGIRFDVFFSERSLIQGETNLVAETIEELYGKGLIYEGTLPPPKGKLPDDWSDREQTLFKATQFGDDVDRALIKADGSYTYFASDMGYHRDKYRRGFKSMIDVWGADHDGYVKRMKAAVKALSDSQAELDIKICQLVRLLRAGEPVKMSKRSGEFIALRDVVDEVGPDVVRFMMLFRRNDATLDFDFVKVQEQSKENPVFYVQYAHARAHSVLYRNIPNDFPEFDADDLDPQKEDLTLLKDEGELALIKRLAQYPRIVEQAARSHEPHRVAFYLFELASDLHAQWSRGTEKPELRFIQSGNRKVTGARAVLVKATGNVIASGLGILGVQPIREMR